MINETLFNAFNSKLQSLVGDKWCPYPSECFIALFLKSEDELAIKLIDQRRKFSFFHFLLPYDAHPDTLAEELVKEWKEKRS